MTDLKIEEMLDRAIGEETPDMLVSLMEEMGLEEGRERTPERKVVPLTGRILKIAGALAASVAIFAAGMYFGSRPAVPAGGEPVAMVGLDVNPSVEIFLDGNDRVTGCEALNAEGEEILSEMDLTGTDIRTAANAIVGAMLTHGYLTEGRNSILVSVTADDPKKGRALEEDLSRELNTFLEDSAAGIAILGEFVEADEATKALAEEQGISLGRAWIIRQLAAEDPRLTETSLLKLSTQDLLILWSQSREKAPEKAGSRYGTVDTGSYVPADAAIAAALTAAGVTGDAVTGLEARFECEDGVIIYEVDFTLNGAEYEFDVDAATGNVLRTEWEEGEDDDLYEPDEPDDDDMDDDDEEEEEEEDDD